MAKKSAGMLLYRFRKNLPEVLLVHPGGPFWKEKDLGAWSIPKGEIEENEDPLQAAVRETMEETGILLSLNHPVPLTPLKQKSGKIIFAWAMEADFSSRGIRSNLFELEWPKGSGSQQFFAEVDRADWFTPEEAKIKIIPGQASFIEELENHLKFSSP